MPSTKSEPSRQIKTAATNQPVDPLDPGFHTHMHHEHILWLSDIANWRDDLVEWERETRNVLAELKQLETMLRQHDLALVDHSGELFAHRQKIVKHEHLLAELEQQGAGEDFVEGARRHAEEHESHINQQTLHEAIKHRHRVIVARWQELSKEISKLPKV